MFDIQYCKNKFRRVEECLEEELAILPKAIKWELGEAYKKALTVETDKIKKYIKSCNL